MKHIHTLFLLALLSVLALASCRDDFDIKTVKGEPRLILYCMPTEGDTTSIQLMRSLPVNQTGRVVPIDGARISYTVNGQPATIIAEGNGHYKAVARQAVGDRISIEAEADSLPAVSAQTTILEPVTLGDVSSKVVSVYSDDYEQTVDYLQLTVPFTDPAGTKDYYAVQVKSLLFWRNDDSYGDMPDPDEVIVDTTAAVCTVYTESDPVLKKLNSIDYDFGYDNNAYENFYVFTDDDFNGKTYTLHLNLDRNVAQVGWHYVSPYYYVELYHITPEFYHFVSTIGSIENSDLAKAGLSNITPNVGNVRNGIGMVAGFGSAKSKIVQHVYDE
jgi:hypothetical protein